MFTGIIQRVAKGSLVKGKLKLERCWDDLQIGESIAVNGVCLTLTDYDNKFMYFDVGVETLKVTNLRFESFFNLERALKLGESISGHFVSGHVDGMIRLITKNVVENSLYLTFSTPQERWGVVRKGSIALNGVSLTIANVSIDTFTVQLIPHTLENTTFKFIKVGTLVNYEIDVLARYVHGIIKKKERMWLDE
ncbi:MAG: riboflavin synthase [Fervidobacterium sp.]